MQHKGDYAGYALLATADNGLKTAYSRVVKASSLGSNGKLVLDVFLLLGNTGATGVNATISIIFGSTTLFTITSSGTGTTTPRYVPIKLRLYLSNKGGASSQFAILEYSDGSARTLSSTIFADWSSHAPMFNVSAEDTASDTTLYVKAQLYTATNSRSEILGSEMLGPYLGA